MLGLYCGAVWILSIGVACGFAKSKGHSPVAWGFIAFFLGPIAVLYVGLAPIYQDVLDNEALHNKTKIRCPACQELKRPLALRCPHCGSESTATSPPNVVPNRPS